MQLNYDVSAVQLHGATGREVADVTLPAGTEYRVEGSAYVGWGGLFNQTILVDGYRYRVYEADLDGRAS